MSQDPHISTVRLRPEDEFLIMGCDGLWDTVSYDTAIGMVSALKKEEKSNAPFLPLVVTAHHTNGIQAHKRQQKCLSQKHSNALPTMSHVR